jgi:hypothetical protein
MTDPTPSDASTPAAVPATVPATETAVAAPAPAAPARGKGLGRFALVLGLLAFIGDIVLIVIACIGAASAFSSITGGNLDFGSILAGLLGLIAAITNRGRAPGIIGLILGILVMISHFSVLGAIAGSGDTLSQLGGMFG